MKKGLKEVLKENRERELKRRYEMMARARKQEKKETMLTILIGLFIVATTVVIITKMNDKYMNDCTNAGHSVNYCERGL
jgi:hypothetical protein